MNIKCAAVEGRDEARVLATASCPTVAAEGPDAVLARVADLGLRTAEPLGRLATAGLALPATSTPSAEPGAAAEPA